MNKLGSIFLFIPNGFITMYIYIFAYIILILTRIRAVSLSSHESLPSNEMESSSGNIC